jgi:hypothetical protein
MFLPRHLIEDKRKMFEIFFLGGTKWILFEKRNDPFTNVLLGSDTIPIDVFSMIIESPIHEYPPASEEALQYLE